MVPKKTSKSVLHFNGVPRRIAFEITRLVVNPICDGPLTSGTRYLTDYYVKNGKVCMHVYAYRNSGYRLLNIEYVAKQVEGGPRYVRHIDCYGMCGKQVFWDGKDRRRSQNSYWGYSENCPDWYKADYHFEGEEIIAENLLIDAGLEHSGWAEYSTVDYTKPTVLHPTMDLIEYAEIYRKYPQIEILSKMGYWWAIRSVRSLNSKGRTPAAVFKISQEQAKQLDSISSINDIYLLRKCPKLQNVSFLSSALKYNTLLEAKMRKWLIEIWREETNEYLLQNELSAHIYVDYLLDLRKLGFDTSDKRYIYPKDFGREHKKMADRVVKEADKEKAKQFIKAVKGATKLSFANDDYLIRPPLTADEMRNEGKTNKNCVGTYIERVANGATTILFLRQKTKPDKPLVTIEVRGATIIQARGYMNENPKEPEQNFINAWAKKNKLHAVMQ